MADYVVLEALTSQQVAALMLSLYHWQYVYENHLMVSMKIFNIHRWYE